MADEATPTTEERAKFYLQNSISLVGYEDTLAEAIGESTNVPRGAGVETVADAIDNLAISFSEGVSRMLSNRREVGHSPVSAWQTTVEDEWPLWVKVGIAESQYQTFGGRARDPDFMTDEEEEYLSFLEEEYDVPR